jgi:hypothetical protein
LPKKGSFFKKTLSISKAWFRPLPAISDKKPSYKNFRGPSFTQKFFKTK